MREPQAQAMMEPPEPPAPEPERKVRIAEKVVVVPRPSSEAARQELRQEMEELRRRQARAEEHTNAALVATVKHSEQQAASVSQLVQRFDALRNTLTRMCHFLGRCPLISRGHSPGKRT